LFGLGQAQPQTNIWFQIIFARSITISTVNQQQKYSVLRISKKRELFKILLLDKNYKFPKFVPVV
jgi:hypothetical protein